MDSPKKTVFSLRTSGDVIVFDIGGEITVLTYHSPTLTELVKSQLDAGRRRILLNFENAGFVDSFGIGELIESYTSIQNRGGMLKLCRLPDRLLLIFKITMLDKVLKIYPTEEAAMEAFADPLSPA